MIGQYARTTSRRTPWKKACTEMHSRMRHDRRFHTCSLVSSASSEKAEPTEGERHENERKSMFGIHRVDREGTRRRAEGKGRETKAANYRHYHLEKHEVTRSRRITTKHLELSRDVMVTVCSAEPSFYFLCFAPPVARWRLNESASLRLRGRWKATATICEETTLVQSR